MGRHQSEDIIDQRLDNLRQHLEELAAILEINAQRERHRQREAQLVFPFSLLAAVIDAGFQHLEYGIRWFVQRAVAPVIERFMKR